MFNGPIPGQSLTKEPKKYPWQRPPEIVDPDEAIMKHVENIESPEIRDNILFALEYGVPVKNLVKMLTTGAVAKGLHSIDVSLLISPVIHEYIVSLAEEAGVKFIEEFSREAEKKKGMEQQAVALLKKSLSATPKGKQDAGYNLLKEAANTATKEAPMPQENIEEQPATKPARGFMQRKAK